jgi:hypothetical protein
MLPLLVIRWERGLPDSLIFRLDSREFGKFDALEKFRF